MKKIVFGSIMILAGVLASALLMAGSMSLDWGDGNGLKFLRVLSAYGLVNVFYIFVVMAIIGLLIAISEPIKTED